MVLDNTYHQEVFEYKKMFDISAFVTAYDFFYGSSASIPCGALGITGPENYPFSQIILVLEGSGEYMTDQGAYPIVSRSMFYRPANHTSDYYVNAVNGRVRELVISFVCDSPAMSIFEGAPILLGEEELGNLVDLIQTATRAAENIPENEGIRGMRFRQDTPDVVLEFIASSLERFLCMLYCRLKGITLLVNERQKVNAFIGRGVMFEEVRTYLRAHLYEQLTLTEICQHFGMSQTGLMRKFRKETGMGLMEYFIDLKIDEAKRRISKTSQSFSEISDALGFSSPNYFSKVFKAKVGMTPTEYSKFASKRRANV